MRKNVQKKKKSLQPLCFPIEIERNVEFFLHLTAKNKEATIVVRVGNNRPDLGVNPICNRFTGVIEEGRPLFLPCNPPMPGAFVSIHFEGKKKKCEKQCCQCTNPLKIHTPLSKSLLMLLLFSNSSSPFLYE